MHILFLNWKDIRHPERGGAEVIAFELARRLVADHEVTWFSRSFPSAPAEESLEGIRTVRRGGLLSTYLHAWTFYRRLRPRPDVVVDMVNTLAWQAPLYARGRTVAYVNQLAREVLLYHLPWPLSRIAYALERFQFRPYRHVPFLCYSESTKADLIEIGIPAHRIKTFPVGLDRARYRPAASGKSPSPLFVFVGRLAPMKRADLCVRAFAEVVERHPEARLAIVGSGPEEPALTQLVHELGLEHAVSLVTRNAFFTGPTSGDPKVDLMQKAWAHVLPSVKEGWGLVVTEAAACGTPSIVTDVTGLRDSVRPNETGLVVSANPSVDELATAMNALIDDPALRDRLSRAALARAADFDWATSVRSFEDRLLDALAESATSGRRP